MGLAAGDIDNDGWFDYFVTNYYNDSLYRSTHGGLDESFTGSALNDPLVGWGTEFFDAENDGDVDLYLANGFIFEQTHDKFQDDKLLENDGRGLFSNASYALGPSHGGVSHGVATADFDLDGDLDLFVFNISGPSMLFRNDGPKGNFLKLNLTGSASNRDAVGAFVNVSAGGRTILRCLTAGASYLSQSDHILHFGLGNATTADQVTIEWPSGARQVLYNVPANQTVSVVEPPLLIARAGGDYAGRPGITLALDAGASVDPLDPTFPAGASYTWSVDLGGVFAVLTGVSPNLTLTSSGAYKGTLRVVDSLGNADDDPFVIYIRDERPPTARAGPDLASCDSDLFTLSGAASFDNDPSFTFLGNYTWTIPLLTGPLYLYGTTVTLRIEVPGLYTVTLTARDPSGNEGSDAVALTVTDCTAPEVFVPASVSVLEGQLVHLVANASDSSLNFSTAANYSWTVHRDEGDQTVFGPDFTYRFTIPGVFQISLVVSDGAGNRANAVVVVIVSDVTPPVPVAADSVSGDEGTLLKFDASNSTDNDPTFPATGTFTWVITVPQGGGGSAALVLFGATPSYAFSTPGRFPYLLTVSDRAGNEATAAGNVSLRDRTPPRVHAGQNLEVTAGSTVTFVATATDNDPAFATDPDGSRYEWSFEYGGVRVPLEGPNPSFRFEQSGVYIVTLTVTDAAGNTASDHLDVRVVSGAADPWPLYHRALAAALIAGAVLVAVPFWRRARAAARLDMEIEK
jgi:PKD repeat protein